MKKSKQQIKELLGIDIEEDYGYIEVLTEKDFKSKKQNNLFHGLLSCFWKSGCSSFNSYKDMRFYYKHFGGLIEYRFENELDLDTKNVLWKAVKILPFTKEQLKEITELLRGKIIIEHSWAECKREVAQGIITQLVNDMFSAQVDTSKESKKFEAIMRDIGEWYE